MDITRKANSLFWQFGGCTDVPRNVVSLIGNV